MRKPEETDPSSIKARHVFIQTNERDIPELITARDVLVSSSHATEQVINRIRNKQSG